MWARRSRCGGCADWRTLRDVASPMGGDLRGLTGRDRTGGRDTVGALARRMVGSF